jgi:hypothetical protein
MVRLTTEELREKKVLNNLSREQDPRVSLGDIVRGIRTGTLSGETFTEAVHALADHEGLIGIPTGYEFMGVCAGTIDLPAEDNMSNALYYVVEENAFYHWYVVADPEVSASWRRVNPWAGSSVVDDVVAVDTETPTAVEAKLNELLAALRLSGYLAEGGGGSPA